MPSTNKLICLCSRHKKKPLLTFVEIPEQVLESQIPINATTRVVTIRITVKITTPRKSKIPPTTIKSPSTSQKKSPKYKTKNTNSHISFIYILFLTFIHQSRFTSTKNPLLTLKIHSLNLPQLLSLKQQISTCFTLCFQSTKLVSLSNHSLNSPSGPPH
jgi:hypothetical protein